MKEMFGKVMMEIGRGYGMTEWWEIFDSEVFEEVETECESRFGEMEGFQTEWSEWTEEMSEDL